jgi:predicted adenine nucleotide alpha hydrolase (AANH) superfamily ATPase
MILVHICCSVDSHYFLQKLKSLHPDRELVGYFYDPNIHPYSEYRLRLLDVEHSCKKLGIKLIEGEYDFKSWLKSVRGYEREPEKGARCDICFDHRLLSSAKKAKEIGADTFTTTLLTSPKKSLQKLSSVGDEIAKKFDLKFLALDLRVDGGTNEQFELARRDQLYHQDYCGCIYALNRQRAEQERLNDELFLPVTAQIQPESIEDRIELYKKRVELEERGVGYKIIRERFLNYRLLRAFVEIKGKKIDSYFLAYSHLKRSFIKTKIEAKIKDFYITKREQIYFLTLKDFNKLSNKSYKNIKDIIKNPPSFDEEIEVRNQIVNNFYSTSPIIIVENIEFDTTYKIYLESKIYDDTREYLVTLV